MTLAAETGAINRFHFLALIFGACFPVPYTCMSAMRISGAKNKRG